MDVVETMIKDENVTWESTFCLNVGKTLMEENIDNEVFNDGSFLEVLKRSNGLRQKQVSRA